MKVIIEGLFQVKKSYQGKNNVFHTLEQFGEDFPLRVQLAHPDMIFSNVGKDQVVQLQADCDMREFSRDGKKNSVFYVDKINFEVSDVVLKPVAK